MKRNASFCQSGGDFGSDGIHFVGMAEDSKCSVGSHRANVVDRSGSWHVSSDRTNHGNQEQEDAKTASRRTLGVCRYIPVLGQTIAGRQAKGAADLIRFPSAFARTSY